MKLNNAGIQDRRAWEAAGYALPQFDREAVREKTLSSPEWIHFGAGNIFRAFQANVVQRLLNDKVMETGLLVAEDNGHVYEFGLDGQLKNTCSFAKPNDAHDWEGITKAADGSIYLSEERTREIYKLSADHKSVTLVSKGPEEAGSEENQGYEGIAAGNGVLYVANQSKPKRVYAYSIADMTWTTAFDADWATSLSDIYYDSDDGTLFITDAKTQKLTQVKTDGTKVQEYSISFVKKPEGFCKDAKNKTFWFICDSTSKLYSVTYN